MTEGKIREKDFNLHTWFAMIPMTDDVYLGLQAQNIARVEMSIMRPYESKTLDEQQADPGSFQGPVYRELMALSQMWVFGVYEFLRTWRQRATELIGFEDTLNSLATQEERDAYLKKIIDEAKHRARLVESAPVYHPDHVAKVGDAAFMKSVRDYKDKTEDLFRELSAVRMPAAKHEVPGKKGVLAEALGIGLINPRTGSICWQVIVGKEKSTIERRDLADKFFGILSWHEDVETAYGLAKEQKTRGKRLQRRRGRRGGRRNKANKDSLSAASQTEKVGPVHVIAPKGKRPFRDMTTYEREVFLAERAAAERRRQTDPVYKAQGRNKANQESPSTASQPQKVRPDYVIAPKGEWPFKDTLMIVRPERRPRKPKE
jgi:hypothetical protein